MGRVARKSRKYDPVTEIVPIVSGGTENDTPEEVSAVFDVISDADREVPLGVLNIINGKINPARLPNIFGSEISLVGKLSVGTLEVTTYFINNYDSFTTYNVSCINGVVSRNNDIITYTGAANAQDIITINGIDFPIFIYESIITTPSITFPISGSNNINSSLIINSSAFHTTGRSDVHLSTDWQLATDVNFSNIIQQSINSSINLTSWTVNNLNTNTTYFVRVRHKGTSIVAKSDWSSIVVFSTRIQFLPINENAIISSIVNWDANYQYNICLSADGSILVIGEWDQTVSGNTGVGVVKIYKSTNNIWQLDTTIQCPNIRTGYYGQTTSNFGRTLSLTNSGDRLVIGAPFSVINTGVLGGNNGEIYIYRNISNVWTLEDNIVSPINDADELFSDGLTIDDLGDRIFVTTKNSTVANPLCKVFIYKRNGTLWSLEDTLTSNVSATQFTSFTNNIDSNTDSSTLVIGYSLVEVGGFQGQGKVDIYKRVGTTWSLQQTIENPFPGIDNSEYPLFGNSLCLSSDGNTLAISCTGESINNLVPSNEGKVYIYKRVGETWSLFQTLISNNISNKYNFGRCISGNDDLSIMAISSMSSLDFNGSDTLYGLVELYTYNNATSLWEYSDPILPIIKIDNDIFGNRLYLSKSGNKLVVTSTNNNDGNNDYYVFN